MSGELARNAQEDSEYIKFWPNGTASLEIARDAQVFHSTQPWKPDGQDDFEGVAEILDTWTWGQMASVTVEGQISLEAYRLMAGLTSRRSRRNREPTPVFDALVSAYELERFVRWAFGLDSAYEN